MQHASDCLDRWSNIVDRVSRVVDLEVSARKHKALLRRRGVPSAEALLHLALLYGPGEMSLDDVASHATLAGIAELCDVSLLARLRKSVDFLDDILSHLLAGIRGETPTDGRLQFTLVDGSSISCPGSAGSDWRLHARYEPARGCFTDLKITEADTAEALECVAVRPAERATPEDVLWLYRMRWQIELAFKRLKSIGGFGELWANDPKLARSWLLAHLIAAVLTEASLSEDLDSPPGAWTDASTRQPCLWRAWKAAHRQLKIAICALPRTRISQARRQRARRRLREPPRNRQSRASQAGFALN